MNANGNRRFFRHAFIFASFLLTSCGRAPAVDILGSFFPGWLVCLVAAILLTVIGRFVLVRFHVNFDLPILAYPSLTALLTFALWLIFFH
jgi:YtcA family